MTSEVTNLLRKTKAKEKMNKRISSHDEFTKPDFDIKKYNTPKKIKALRKELEEREAILSSEILQQYPVYIQTYDNINEVSEILKTMKGQLSQYSMSISSLKSKIDDFSQKSNNNEWQNYINHSLDNNWEVVETQPSQDYIICKNAIPEGNFEDISRMGQPKDRDIHNYVTHKIEDILLKAGDKNDSNRYQECAKIFTDLTQKVDISQDELVKKIDNAYNQYVQELSRSIMMSGQAEHVNALIMCDCCKTAAKSLLFYQSNQLGMSLEKVDKTLKSSDQFEAELNAFVDFLIITKIKYIEMFSELNEVVLENIVDSKKIQFLQCYLKPWIEEQLETFKPFLSKYISKLRSSKHKTEYQGILRKAMNKLDKEGISIAYKIDQFISRHDLMTIF
ncbi:unnamed protein product [Moneuplotes crassus]|uniref:Uncharacterized protein n=2 Tax=Euplotes crassus TaxID=5936 RepID=A0AAD1ULN9_EUPCR|nr:unnamed protein product [Moneuplotes crassus]